jgi:hypothetical protein
MRYDAPVNIRSSAVALGAFALLWSSCGASKPDVPALTPQSAAALLQIQPKSKNWLTQVQKEAGASCRYEVELPDQSAHPTQIDVSRIITCGGKPAPRSLDASVSYQYDAASGRWIISRFSN